MWLPCDGETKDQEGNNTREKGTSLSFLPPLNDNDRLVLGSRRSSPPGASPQVAGPHRFSVKPAVRVRSNLNEHGLRCVDYTARAFDTPPKKKHCRSLSVPADTPPQAMGVVASTSPLVEGAKVWRPIPITALSTPGSSSSSGGSSSAAQPDTRSLLTHFASPHHDSRTLSSFTAIGSTAARFHRDFKVVGVVGSGGGGGGGGTTTTTTLPMAPSPLSIDSGRDTTSDLHTPPQSPVPRPSSATSLRSCHTAFSASWWSNSPGRLRGEVLQSRSLSYEEQMSTGLQAAVSGSSPCVVGTGSVPLSPCRSKIPRCHSQPCVLHDRRCGKKRRREDRPTLDFHKMTEVS